MSAKSVPSASLKQPGMRVAKKEGSILIDVAPDAHIQNPIILDALSSKTDIEITIGAGAVAHIVTIVTGQKKHVRQIGKIGTDASVHWHNVTLGTGIEHSLIVTIEGANARSSIDWVFHAKNTDSQRISARNVFMAENGGGEILMKGIAEGRAHVKCDGMIEIGLEGRGTQTHLTESVLMLDPSARVDAIPALEIKTNDVKASHSATVAKIGVEELFYLASRGIDEKQARTMFIEGFLASVIERIPDASVRESILRKLGK